MKRIAKPLIIAALALGTSACMTTPRAGPTDVTRYHLGSEQIRPGSFTVEPLSTTGTMSLEYRSYGDAVASELTRLGYTRVGEGLQSNYVAQVSFRRAPAGVIRQQSPFSIGLGGGSFGRNVGVGGGVSLPVGGGGLREVTASELAVQLRRRSDSTVVWEGRAVAQSVAGTPDAANEVMSAKLASALFRGFPGDSGITITVR
ncbi:DUF4136 domain-containing protein [Sphingomonas aestuarii]|jgi:hypothetical protein